MPAEPAPEPLLNLDTIIVRKTIEVDDVRYEILSPDELSVLDTRRFALWAQRIEALQADMPEAADPDAEGEDRGELDELVGKMARKALVGVPDDVFARLSGFHRMQVCEVFTALLLLARTPAVGAIQGVLGNPLIGALSYLGSRASTAAAPASGWRSFLSRLFART